MTPIQFFVTVVGLCVMHAVFVTLIDYLFDVWDGRRSVRLAEKYKAELKESLRNPNE